MPGIGTIVNTAAIVIGGLLGLFLGKFLSETANKTVLAANGLAVIVMGIQGAMAAEDSMMLIFSLCIGGLLGGLIDLEGRLEGFGVWLKNKTGNASDKGFVNAFVDASLTVCVGAMAIVGSIQDGLLQDPSTLYAKAILDFAIIFVMASSMGKGVVFSAVPVAIFQGVMTVFALWIAPVFTADVLANISSIGSVLILGVGINLVFGRKVPVANLLPSLIIAGAWPFLSALF
jgi:hypothetical protein